ncbi:MAG TPA: GNAT family N-acetyltransferase [Thermoleophilaceae bacterium]
MLRLPREEDAPAIFEACQDPEIPRWTNVPSPYTEDNAWSFVRGAQRGEGHEMSLVIAGAVDDSLIGAIGLRQPAPGVGDVGYWLAAPARGRGLTTRALRLLCAWGFEELALARIQLHTLPGNVASERVAERAGFTREGLLRSFTEMKGKRVDITMFSLLPGER